MNNRIGKREMEERLADYTDRLLTGEKPVQDDAFEPNHELAGLEKTVRSITGAVPPRQPDPGLRSRLRGRLTVEWNANRSDVRDEPVKWRSSGKKTQVYLAWSALAAVVVILIGSFIAPLVTSAQPGAAQFQTGTIVVVVIVLGIIGLLLWWLRNKS
jgi:hypothetical protein